MAEAPGGGSGLKKEVAGQPLWIWLAGAGVVLLGYWYFTKKSSTSKSGSGSGSGSGKGSGGRESSSSSVNETITDWQNPPGHGSGGGGTSEGPEREWLEHKTGSQHPWTYLARHHERIEVGPTGSRKVIKDS